jgi:hypothetical protein
MLKVLNDGNDKHRLEDGAGKSIGWINGRSIGFRGFATESDARDAAIVARRTLDAALRQEYPTWPCHDAALEETHSIHDGPDEWLYAGTRAIARLLRPQRRAYDYSFGIELVLPSYASEGVAITAAHSLARAVAPYRDELAAQPDAAKTSVAGGAVVARAMAYDQSD